MAPSINLTSNAPVSPASSVGTTSTTGSPSQDGVIKLDQIEIGKVIQAQVISLLSNGNSLVSLQNGAQTSNLQMRLPAGVTVGDQIQLSLLSLTDGKPSFSISLLTATETVNLSSTAQLLDKLSANNSNQQPKVSSATPLLTSAKELDPTHIATQLAASIDKSGVFYESHLQQWNEGSRNIDQIRQEPQNQSATPTETANALIPAQLDTLENKRLAWQGELYPGLSLQLDINKDDEQASSSSSSSAQASDPVWQTSLKLQLPNLGPVHVKIRLQGEHAQLSVNAADSETATVIKSASDTLAQSLAASGTALDILTVQSDDKP
jgi:Flagellar hook-length control protein FliK